MDGMLTQDEINALLNGMDLSGNGNDASNDEPAAAQAAADRPTASAVMTSPAETSEDELTEVERDAIGEIANISMGTAATTLFALVNRRVEISTPVVSLTTWDEMTQKYEKPCVFIRIAYTVGLDGSNILVLKEKDVMIITDLMMGGDGTDTE